MNRGLWSSPVLAGLILAGCGTHVASTHQRSVASTTVGEGTSPSVSVRPKASVSTTTRPALRAGATQPAVASNVAAAAIEHDIQAAMDGLGCWDPTPSGGALDGSYQTLDYFGPPTKLLRENFYGTGDVLACAGGSGSQLVLEWFHSHSVMMAAGRMDAQSGGPLTPLRVYSVSAAPLLLIVGQQATPTVAAAVARVWANDNLP